MDPLQMVRDYHERAKLPINEDFNLEQAKLRARLLKEEAEEALDEASGKEYGADLLKELADVLYVTYGWAVTRGWDLNEAFRRVHENNMGRMVQDDGTIQYREDGKVMKNKNYPKVDLKDLVND